MMLTGKRRTLLKITAYKELIRLLSATPSDEHVKMILHEWNREEIHRDVRISILLVGKLVFIPFLHLGDLIPF